MTTCPRVLFGFVILTIFVAAGCGPTPLNSPTPGPSQEAAGGNFKPGEVELARSDKPRAKNPSASPEDLKALADGNATFAFDLYRTLRGAEGNLFYSPYSISAALAMTYAGAAGDTASQMVGTLHFTLPGASLHRAFNAYSQDLQARAGAVKEGTPFEVDVANSLWGQKDFAFRKEFLDLLAENYGAGMRLVDFAASPEPSRQAINQWASEETKGRIKDLIPSGVVDAMTRLVLANAIYFKAGWLHPFANTADTTEPFHLLDGSTVDVPMMNQNKEYGYALMQDYKALELPYQSGNVSMMIILPDPGRFQTVEESLTAGTVGGVVGNMKYGPVILGLPKFSYESTFNLNEALKTLGMGNAFDPAQADFSGMDGNRDLYIGDVMHKAFVAVDEKGTEAAAATAVVMEMTAAQPIEPISFKVDRPFVFLIRDGQSGTILFVGRVMNPLK